MQGSASAYAVLGLEPGADRAAVEQAYRRLIKLHHPDRSGGDAKRAAEINRAYFELRQQAASAPVFTTSSRPRPSRHGRRRGRVWPLLVMVLAVLLVIEWPRLAEQAPQWIEGLAQFRPPVPGPSRASVVHVDSSAIDGPLDEPAVADAIRQAERLAKGDREALARHSRDCHRRMRAAPHLAQLDRCAAFDDAVAALADRELPGAFSASAVTARQMTAASLLSSDFLAIERRLDRIRTLVQLTVRPRLPPLPPPPPPAEAAEDEPLPAPDEI